MILPLIVKSKTSSFTSENASLAQLVEQVTLNRSGENFVTFPDISKCGLRGEIVFLSFPHISKKYPKNATSMQVSMQLLGDSL